MYDDGDKIKTYAPAGAGSLKWKFAGGPKAEYDADGKPDPKYVEALVQQRHHHHKLDSFDHDPTTSSMYDDGDKVKTYAPAGAGTLKWKFAGGPKAEYDADGKPDPKYVEALSQQRHHRKNKKHHRHHRNTKGRGADTFDNDDGTTSMYDDGHVYSEAGQFKVAQDPAKKALA